MTKYSASRKPAPAQKPRSVAECAEPAANTVVVCALGIGTTVAAAPTVVASFVGGAVAGATCADKYFEYAASR
ncbi:MAG TPA: hypothetical protein PKA88_31955 [Polyangiaceae bacterium]|nr:hypothetical protein [Polyangiaceae bacterium]